MAEMRASPVVNPKFKRIAEVLRDLQGPMGEIIPFTDANPFRALMPAASTFENLAYGNSPFSEYAGVTNRRLPIVKTGREGELTDLADVALMATGVRPAMRGVKIAADEAGDAMVRFLTGNPKATAMGVLDEAGQMSPLAGIAKIKGIPINEILFPGKTVKELAPHEKRALTKFEKDLAVPAVRRREEMRVDGETIVTPTQGLEMIKEVAFNPENLVGKRLVPVFGDTSRIGGDVQQIKGVPLSKPVVQQGGFQYPLVKSNVAQDIAYASEPGAASGKIANFRKFPDEDVLGVFLAGGPRSIDFSHHQAQALVRQLDAIRPSSAAVKNFDKALREYWVDKKDKFGKPVRTYPFKNVKTSITSPDMEVMMAERTTKDFSPGQLRTAIADLMSEYNIQKQGFPVYNDALEAMVDPRLQQGYMGQTIFEAIPGRGIQTPTYTHQSYSAGIPGRYLGGLQGRTGELTGVPAELLFPKLFAEKRAKGKTQSNILTSMLKSHQGEVFTEEALDPLMQFLGR